jgi:hypothetical protein
MTCVQNNLYNYAQSMDDPDHFVGRSTLLAHCQEIIGKRGCLSLVGGPCSGLTLLLKRLLGADIRQACSESGEQLRMLYLDCTRLPDPCNLVYALLAELAPEKMPQQATRWQECFRQLIRTMDDCSQDARLVLLLDDFEAISGNERYIDFLDRFRGLTNHVRMTLITATHTELRFCCHMSLVESPFPTMFSVEYLSAFTEEEALELISRASEAYGVDLLPHAAEMLALSGRMPYLLQLACWRFHQAALAQESLDHQKVEAFVLAKAEPMLARIWHSLDAQERETLCTLSRGSSPDKIEENLVLRGYSDGSGICSTALATYVAEMS